MEHVRNEQTVTCACIERLNYFTTLRCVSTSLHLQCGKIRRKTKSVTPFLLHVDSHFFDRSNKGTTHFKFREARIKEGFLKKKKVIPNEA